MTGISSLLSRRAVLLSNLGRAPDADVALELCRSGLHVGRLGVAVRDRRHGQLARVRVAVTLRRFSNLCFEVRG